MPTPLKSDTPSERINNLDTLAGIFRAMQKLTEVHGPELPITGTAENFYKYMLDAMAVSCQWAANELRASNCE
jgi:hypothetical protein